LKNVLFSLFAIFIELSYYPKISIFYLHNLLIDNISKKCRFIKIIWQIIRIKCHFIPIIWQNILAFWHSLKILPLKNVLFSLLPFLFFHFNVLKTQTIVISQKLRKPPILFRQLCRYFRLRIPYLWSLRRLFVLVLRRLLQMDRHYIA
jgi:hypothetical protein